MRTSLLLSAAVIILFNFKEAVKIHNNMYLTSLLIYCKLNNIRNSVFSVFLPVNFVSGRQIKQILLNK
jgi:hypothetical protein